MESTKKEVKFPTITVEPFIFLFMLAASANLTTLPLLTLVKVCNMYFNRTVCFGIARKKFEKEEDIVHSTAAFWDISQRCSTLIPAFCITLFIGTITDKIGRRKILLIQPIIRALQSFLLVVNSYFMELHPGFLLLATFTTGFGGAIHGGTISAYAYIADVTEQNESRSIRMTILSGVSYISAGLGGLMGGMLVEYIGYKYTYCVTFWISGINFCYVYFFVPDEQENPRADTEEHEDVKAEHIRNRQKLSKWNNFTTHIRNYLRFINLSLKTCTTKSIVTALICINILYQISHKGYVCVIPFYIKHYPFNFSAENVGIFVFFDQLCKGFGSLIVLNIALRYFSINDYSLLLISFTMQVALYLAIGTANSTTILYSALIFGCGAALPGGVLPSIITKNVPNNLHGSAVGLLATSNILAAVLASVAASSLYAATVSWYAGFVYYILASGPLFATVTVTCLIYRNVPDSKESQETVPLRDELEQTSDTD